LSHALIDLGRGLLDYVFFGPDFQALRLYLSSIFPRTGPVGDHGVALDAARERMDDLERDRWVRLLEQALRQLNRPANLARAELGVRMSRTLDANTVATLGRGLQDVTPLERAQAMRAVLVSAIERL